MNFYEVILLAFALSLDSFSVALTCGTRIALNSYHRFFKVALFFSFVQFCMPPLGYLVGDTVLKKYIMAYAGFVAFGVFFLLGVKNFIDYGRRKNDSNLEPCLCSGYRCVLSLALATSLDAFIIGSVMGIQNMSLWLPSLAIGCVTFINSFLGCMLGNRSVLLLKDTSRLLAGVILLLLAFFSLL